MKIPSMNKEKITEVNQKILSFIEEFEGVDPLIIDVKGRSSVADYFIVAHFNSNVAMQAAYEAINSYLKDEDLHIEKQDRKAISSDWIAVDGGFTVTHLMSKEARSFYSIEKLWELERI